MKSLRRRLLVSLLMAVLLVGAASAWVAYRQANYEAKELLDGELRHLAGIIASQTAGTSLDVPAGDEDIEVAVWGADGQLVYSSTPLMSATRGARPGLAEVTLGREPYRVYTGLAAGRRIVVAQPVDLREDQAEAAALASLLPVIVLLPVLALVIAFVIRALLQPVRAAADAVSKRDPLAREPLQVQNLPAEVAPLVDEINRLLERQGDALERERHFVADAAHALRTPLAALQLQVDVLEGSDEPAERAARLAALRAGIQRATRLADQLLSLARSAAVDEATGQTVDLDASLRETWELYQPSAASGGVALRLDARSGATVRADQRRLSLIWGNLLDNALRYTRPGGEVELIAQSQDGVVRIEVRDEGPGLAPQEIGRVFERFYRVSGDRSNGSGLGLATVASLVTQLDGGVSLQNRTDRSGLIATVVLPLARVP